MHFVKIGPSRQRPKTNEIFAIKISDIGVLHGRVVSTDVATSPFGKMFEDSTLVYIYKHISEDPNVIPENLSIDVFLMPPLIIGSSLWSKGYAKRVKLVTPVFDEILAQHCFYSHPFDAYYDDHGTKLPERTEPCGSFGIITLFGIDQHIRHALGLPTEVDFD